MLFWDFSYFLDQVIMPTRLPLTPRPERLSSLRSRDPSESQGLWRTKPVNVIKWTKVGVGGGAEAQRVDGLPFAVYRKSHFLVLCICDTCKETEIKGMVISENLAFGIEFIFTENLIALNPSCFLQGYLGLKKIRSNRLCFQCWFSGTFLKCQRNDESVNYRKLQFSGHILNIAACVLVKCIQATHKIQAEKLNKA